MSDFDVFIAKDGETYRYLINNANFESFIKVIKVDAETGNTIPYAGAGFQIFRPDGSKVEMTFTYPEVTTIDTFYTNDAGIQKSQPLQSKLLIMVTMMSLTILLKVIMKPSIVGLLS